ncbi:hypothetical protein ACQ4PT_039291 [Festuca glaucescens]
MAAYVASPWHVVARTSGCSDSAVAAISVRFLELFGSVCLISSLVGNAPELLPRLSDTQIVEANYKIVNTDGPAGAIHKCILQINTINTNNNSCFLRAAEVLPLAQVLVLLCSASRATQETVAARCAVPALFYLCEVIEDGLVLVGVELELPSDGGAIAPCREFFWSMVWHNCFDAYDQVAVQAIKFLQGMYGFVVRDYNYDCMVAYRDCVRYFTTFTCNPKWPEIAEALSVEPGQKPHNRADITVRVYHMKLQEYPASIRSGKAFGKTIAVLHTVEFQKRGLPHADILVWQDKEKRGEVTPALIDSFILAKIPDPVEDPLGYALVAEFMMHGPCGEHNPKCPCMKDGMAFNLLSDIHSDSNQWTIRVLVSRMWHYCGGTDEGAIHHTDPGNHMYGQLPSVMSERLKDALEEGKVFVIRKFMCAQSKTAFRPIESAFMVQFTRYNTVEEVSGLADTYPFCTYSLTAFSDIPDPISCPARFIGARILARLVLWGDRVLEFYAEAVRAMGEKEPVIAIFVGKLSKTSHGVKGLSGSSACRWYIDEDIPDINLFYERASAPKRGARHSLFPSPSKDRSHLDKDSALAADGVLAPGEETATESLVQTTSDDAIAVGGDKDNQIVLPKPKRNTNSTKSSGLAKKLKL